MTDGNSLNGIRLHLTELVAEALVLRRDNRLEAVHDMQGRADALLGVRVRVDRVEEILATALSTRGRVRRHVEHIKAQTEDAFDTALVKQRKQPVSLDGDYLAAKERYAMANLETLELRSDLRRLAELADEADEAVEIIRLTYRGLTDLRHDLMTLLRAAQFETTLDR